MAKSKNDNYIITELKKDIILAWGLPGAVREEYVPGRNRPMEHVIWLDGDVGPGIFYSECLWFFPPDMVHPEEIEKMARAREVMKESNIKVGPQPHVHPFDELFTFFGTNYDDPHDLGGEIEFWLEDRQFIFDKSCMVLIPAGMKHCPLEMRRIDKPIFHFSMGHTPRYDYKVMEGDGKYVGADLGKYFVYQDKPNAKIPEWGQEIPREVGYRVAYVDGEVVPGGEFYAEGLWFWPGGGQTSTQARDFEVKAHTHSFPEVIGFIGTNEEDIHDLQGEIELWIDGKQRIIDKSFVAVIPEGVEHCPLRIRRIEKPVFHFTAGPGKMYG